MAILLEDHLDLRSHLDFQDYLDLRGYLERRGLLGRYSYNLDFLNARLGLSGSSVDRQVLYISGAAL